MTCPLSPRRPREPASPRPTVSSCPLAAFPADRLNHNRPESGNPPDSYPAGLRTRRTPPPVFDPLPMGRSRGLLRLHLPGLGDDPFAEGFHQRAGFARRGKGVIGEFGRALDGHFEGPGQAPGCQIVGDEGRFAQRHALTVDRCLQASAVWVKCRPCCGSRSGNPAGQKTTCANRAMLPTAPANRRGSRCDGAGRAAASRGADRRAAWDCKPERPSRRTGGRPAGRDNRPLPKRTPRSISS